MQHAHSHEALLPTADSPESMILYALLAGIGIAMIAGPLGCFVVWRRMAYFGDSLAHSALLGIAIGLIYGIGSNLGTVLVCSLFATLLVWLQHKKILATDTLLGILAHAALAIGMVVTSFLDHLEFDLHDYLFGDILAVHLHDLYWIYGGGAIALLLLAMNWSPLLLMTIHEDLAKSENVNSFWMNLLLMFLLTLIVAVSIRMVGILLITSLLIIPSATARQLTRSPEMMALLASVLGITAVIVGILTSEHYGTPSGPSIVATAATMFAILLPISLLRNKS